MKTSFENEKISVSLFAPHTSAEAVNFECTLLSTTSGRYQSSDSKQLKIVPADGRWLSIGLDAGDGLNTLMFQANRNLNFMLFPFSLEFKINFRKLFAGRTGDEHSI